jgi:hypothetical protein
VLRVGHEAVRYEHVVVGGLARQALEKRALAGEERVREDAACRRALGRVLREQQREEVARDGLLDLGEFLVLEGGGRGQIGIR